MTTDVAEARFSVRVLLPGGRVEEVGTTNEPGLAESWAQQEHSRRNRRVWVLNTATRRIVREIEPEPSERRLRRGRPRLARAGGAA